MTGGMNGQGWWSCIGEKCDLGMDKGGRDWCLEGLNGEKVSLVEGVR